MYAFLLLALPGAIVWHCTTNRSYKFKAFIPPVLLGVFSAVIICIIREFLLTSADIVEESFFLYFICDALNNTALPALILFAAFYFISNDKIKYKFLSIFPLEASFFAILLPFTVITGENRISFFLNTCLPLIFLSSISISTTTSIFSLKAESLVNFTIPELSEKEKTYLLGSHTSEELNEFVWGKYDTQSNRF